MKIKMQKLWNQYIILWKKNKNPQLFLFYLIHYTLFFILICYFIFISFRVEKKSFIWTADGMPVGFSFMVYRSQTIRNGIQSLLSGKGWSIPLYDFRFGVAKPLLTIEPLQLLAIFFPWDEIDVFYNLLTIVQYYLTGLTFSIFGFYFNRKPLSVLIGAISYTFCGFTLFAGVRHLFFMTPVILFPLLVVGLEKVLRKDKPYLLTAVVFLATISNVYFSCMLAIIAGLYILVRFPDIYISPYHRLQEFIYMIARFVIWGSCGIALAAFSIMPNLLQILDTGRVGRDISYINSYLYYEPSYYQKFWTGFMLDSNFIGAWTILGFSALSIIAIILLFVERKKEYRSLRIMFLLLTSMLCIPAVAYVMSGFNALLNRWCFAYAFCICAILMFQVPHFVEIKKKALFSVALWIIVYIIICYFIVKPDYFSEGAIILLVLTFLLIMVCHFLGIQGRYLLLPFCLIFTCVSIYYSAFLLYDVDQGNYVSEFIERNDAYKQYKNSIYSSFAQSNLMEKDKTFYRVSGDILRSAINASFYYGINGISVYDNLRLYNHYMDWLDELEVARQRPEKHCLYGISSRSAMLSLLGVKYDVWRETSRRAVPYGFEKADCIQNDKNRDFILENKYALPIGYTYRNYISADKYNRYIGIEKQEALLQAVVLKEAPNLSSITEGKLELHAQQILSTIRDMKGLNWKDGELNVSEDNATMTLTFEAPEKAETYLRILNLDLTNGASTRRWNITATTGEITAKGYFAADVYLYTHGVKTQLLNLGCSEGGYTTCTITFPKKGTFKLEDLQIWCQPMALYGEQIEALRKESLENVALNWRGLTGNISVSEDKMLCFSIPYDKGWSAYVDGQKVKLHQANTAFMAVELSKGDHKIELRYWVPGLTLGITISILGIISLAVAIIYYRKKEKKGEQ